MSNEEKALAFGNNSDAVRRRLEEAKGLLLPEFKKHFVGATYDETNRCLESTSGRFRLQWMVRFWPDKPVSYTNQQTNSGIVVCLEIILMGNNKCS